MIWFFLYEGEFFHPVQNALVRVGCVAQPAPVHFQQEARQVVVVVGGASGRTFRVPLFSGARVVHHDGHPAFPDIVPGHGVGTRPGKGGVFQFRGCLRRQFLLGLVRPGNAEEDGGGALRCGGVRYEYQKRYGGVRERIAFPFFHPVSLPWNGFDEPGGMYFLQGREFHQLFHGLAHLFPP